MIRTLAMVLVGLLTFSGETRMEHGDYVPDQKTAERIADAVLVAQFGEERVNVQRPLHAESAGKDYWLVQGYVHGSGLPKIGGGFAVWINKHSGCIEKVAEHTK